MVPKYGCRGTVAACFALVALDALKCWLNSTLRELLVHPKYSRNGTVSRAFPLAALIAPGAFFHSALGAARCSELSGFPWPSLSSG